ncbi:MAG: transcriptional regulator [Marinilabiliales bacterium]|nr:MAG: transcriptional regulator [Marinilabiliales bacterium]
MNRIDRLTAILIHLQSKNIVTASEIAERFDISKRTVYRDIRALEEAGIPIGSEAGVGYFIVDSYHLPPVGFSKEEASALLIASKLTQKLTDKTLQDNLNSAIYKIRSILNVTEKEFVENIDRHIEVFSSSPIQNKNIPERIIDTILKGIDKKQVLKLTYNSFSKNEDTCREVEPVGICHYSFNWHLIAYCKLRKDYRDFRIDRIKNIQLTNVYFIDDNKPSIREYFDNFTSSNEVFLVKLLFNKMILPEINQAKYYFGFIEEIDLGDKIEMSFLSNSEDYIGKWIITLLDAVEIIEPESLKSHVAFIVKKLHNIYKPS